MTQPLAIVAYEELKPGSQLVNRLQDLQYRVQAVSTLGELVGNASHSGTMLIFMDLGVKHVDPCAIISTLKKTEPTAHIPIIAFADDGSAVLQAAAKEAGATVVVTDAAILAHLPELIQQALQSE